MRSSPPRPAGAPRLALALGLAASAAVGLQGCNGQPDRSPHITSLSPASGSSLAPVAVTIRGAGFHPRAVQSASGGAPGLDTTHQAWLDRSETDPGVRLDVTWRSTSELAATVPGGLPEGPHALTVVNALGHATTLAGAWTVTAPATLALSLAVDPARSGPTTFSTGQPFTLRVTAENGGGTPLTGVKVELTPTGGGAFDGALAVPPFDLLPGEAKVTSLPLVAATPGELVLQAAATGSEAGGGSPVTAPPAAETIAVQARAALSARLTIPGVVAAGGRFPVSLTVTNDGEAAVSAVRPVVLEAGPGAATFDCPEGPVPGAWDLPGRGQATFTWACRPTAAGALRLHVRAEGSDVNGAGLVWAEADSDLAEQAVEATAVVTDPFGDGTAVAALAVRGGRLLVGPGQDGATFWRLDPTSGASERLGVELAVDDGASQAGNAGWRGSPPARTFGAVGCSPNSLACGPDNEDGRGALAAGSFSGAEWLLYAGASNVKARYAYLSAGEASPLRFRAVDLDAILPATSVAATALAFAPSATAGDRVYLAFTDKIDKKSPHLVALSTAPTADVLDAAAPGDAVDLGVFTAPGIGGDAGLLSNPDPQPRVEALAWFRDRLYLATGSAILRSAVTVPGPYASGSGDWAPATPVTTSWLLRRGLTARASAGLTPADRAVPAMAQFGACGDGPCLFAARNVEGAGGLVLPQLHRCDPSRSGAPDACDVGDWSLAAGNGGGRDPTLTQLDDASNGPVTLLLATPAHLYLGFDNATTGLQIWRTSGPTGGPSDFTGHGGCAAGSPGCVGLGGHGFGDPTVTRILDARAVTSGGTTTLYVLAGDAAGPVRLFALPE